MYVKIGLSLGEPSIPFATRVNLLRGWFFIQVKDATYYVLPEKCVVFWVHPKWLTVRARKYKQEMRLEMLLTVCCYMTFGSFYCYQMPRHTIKFYLLAHILFTPTTCRRFNENIRSVSGTVNICPALLIDSGLQTTWQACCMQRALILTVFTLPNFERSGNTFNRDRCSCLVTRISAWKQMNK